MVSGKDFLNEKDDSIFGSFGRIFSNIPLLGGAGKYFHEFFLKFEPLYWRRIQKTIDDKSNYFGPKKGKFKILFINHFFEQDIESVLEANKEHRIMVLPYNAIREYALIYLPKQSITDFGYFITDDAMKYRKIFREKIKAVVDKIYHAFPFDAVVTPSDFFFWIREFADEVKCRKIPFILLDKEGTINPHFYESRISQIKRETPPISDYNLVWSERQKIFWERIGYPSDKISVVGQPRSDFWFHKNKWKTKSELGLDLRAESKLVLLFTFFAHVGYMMDEFRSGYVTWEDMRSESIEYLLEFAKKHPDTDVVLKTHPQEPDIEEIRKMISEVGVNNIKLATGSQVSKHLIVNADVIIGFQTTALMEAMIHKKHVIYTWWGKFCKIRIDDVYPFHKCGGIRIIEKVQDYIPAIGDCLSNPLVSDDDIAARQWLINEYFGKVDGKVGERVISEIERICLNTKSH